MRKTTFIGVTGGALGALAAGVMWPVADALSEDGLGDVALIVVGYGLAAFLLGVGGIVGALIARTHRTMGLVLLFGPGVLGFLCIWTFWLPAGVLLLTAGALEALSGARPRTKRTRPHVGKLHARISAPQTSDHDASEDRAGRAAMLETVRRPSSVEVQEDESTGGFVLRYLDEWGEPVAHDWYLLLGEAKESARRQFGVKEDDWRELAEETT